MYSFKKLLAILIIIFLFHCALDIYYLEKDALPPPWDQSVHLRNSLTYYHLIENRRFADLIKASQFYPPFFYLTTAPFYLFLGKSADVATGVNLIYLLILIFALYGIGKVLFNQETGVLAAAMISFYPFIIYLRRNYLLDFALVSMIALSIYAFLKSSGFKNSKFSFLFGLTAGLAILTKWTAAFFLIPFLIFFFYQLFQAKNFSNKKILKNILISFFIFIAITGIWYIPNLGRLYPELLRWRIAKLKPNLFEADPNLFSLDSLLYYLKALKTQISFFFLIIALFGFISLCWDKKYKNQKILLGISFIIPYIIFSFIKNKDVRYTIPLAIVFCLVSSFGISKINNKKIKKGVVFIILLVGFLQTLTVTLGYPNLNMPWYVYPPANFPKKEDWQVEHVLNDIGLLGLRGPKNQSGITITILPDHPFVNGLTYQYFSYLQKRPYIINNAAYFCDETRQNDILNSNYVIYKTGLVEPFSPYRSVVEEVYGIFNSNIYRFNLLKIYELPDGSVLLLYEKINLPK